VADNIERIRLYLGTGCGKTTATFGVLIRAISTGKNASIVFFDKLEENSSEGKVLRYLAGGNSLSGAEPDVSFGKLNVNYTGVNRLGTGPNGSFRLYSSPNGILPEDKEAAKQGLGFLRAALERGDDVVVADELLDVGRVGLVSWDDIRAVIHVRKDPTVLLMTGRKAPDWLMEEATTVTSTIQLKHHGRALAGLDC
jgi:cob(I)alamin adenosyltransferase